MDQLTLVAQTAYHDLRRLLIDEQMAPLRGYVVRKRVGGRDFLYDRYRSGDRDVWHYIGPATPELEERLASASRPEAGDRRAQRARLVRILRAEGLNFLDVRMGSLVAAMARVGVFRLGGTLVGTMAFLHYEAELGVRFPPSSALQTGDVDIASFERLSLAIADKVTEPVADVLRDLRFDPMPSLDHRRTWRWRDTSRETLVEFLTPSFGEEGLRELPALGVAAQSLHYLNFLLREPIKAAALYRSGILVQIPRPEAYAIHKLIVADRRTGPDALKAEKDRRQAAILIEILARDRPDELWEAWTSARAEGPRWRERLDRTLARMPETRARLDALDA